VFGLNGGYFESLAAADSVREMVDAFLTGAGRSDTLAHIRQVVIQARMLAARFAEDPEPDMKRAALAAWCHDIAAVVPRDALIAEAERWGVALTESDRAIPLLVHGPLAAAVAQARLGVEDEDTLNAIRFHSTLRAGASTLEKIVFVADKLALDPTAPRSDFLPVLQAAREQGLDAMALVYTGWVIQCAAELGWTVHENLRAAHGELSAARAAQTSQ
jgi:predicted HD superfamily hydrolase involved in NAD metabolism